ncbi:MAG: hypothetical protein KAT35_05485, partial [Candidatus Aenigmarchaeota archaeon]|nr:hypothetical protein [Candidatus Aenigmarchaeota archaeon]
MGGILKPDLELAPSVSFLTRQDTKSLILQILAKDWPLSAKEVYNKARTRHGLDITYQGVHKILRQLVLEDALSFENNKYALRLDWIRNLRKFGEAAERSYLKKNLQTAYLEIGVGSSVERDAFLAGKEAAEKAMKQLKHKKKLQLVLLFTSQVYEDVYDRLSGGVHSVTKKAPLAGCSTFGEIANRPLAKSVVVMLFSADSSDFSAQTICLPIQQEQYDSGDFTKTAAELKRQLKAGGRMPDLGILLTPGYLKSNGLRTITPALLNQLINKSKLPFPLTGG